MKKIFIWENLSKVSNSYHSGGGLVIIAEDLEEAKSLAQADGNIKFEEGELNSFKEFVVMGEATSEVIVFPDAGCC